jgi:hypothetical protein
MSDFETVDELMLQKLYNECTDPDKGTLDEFRVIFLANRINKVKLGIYQHFSPVSQAKGGGRNSFPK